MPGMYTSSKYNLVHLLYQLNVIDESKKYDFISVDLNDMVCS